MSHFENTGPPIPPRPGVPAVRPRPMRVDLALVYTAREANVQNKGGVALGGGDCR